MSALRHFLARGAGSARMPLAFLGERWRRWFPFGTPAQMLVSLLKLGGLLILLLPLIWWFAAYPLIHFYTPKTMVTLSGKTQTYCMGRYLIDVPLELGPLEGSAELYWGLESDFKKVEIVVRDGSYTREMYERTVAERVAKLKTTFNNGLKIPLLLDQEVWRTPHGDFVMLRLLDGHNYPSEPVRSEVHMRVGQRYAIAFGVTYDDDILDKPNGCKTYKHVDPSPQEDLLKRVAMNVQGYTDAKRAPEGYCFSGLVLNEKTMGYDVETGSFGARNEQQLPHTHFGTLVQGQFQQKQESLVQRAKRMNARMAPLAAAEGVRMVDLRLGERSLDGIPGLEWIVADWYPKGVYFQMQAETHQEKAKQSILRPSMYFTLDVGEVTTIDNYSPLTEQQTLHVWDGLLNSLRLSPANGGHRTEGATVSEVIPAVRVGEACPRSGIWEAQLPPGHRAAQALAGSGPNKFRKVASGEPMPEMYAAFMFPRTAAADNAQITWHWVKDES